MGLRELLIAAIVILAAYVAYQFFRVARLAERGSKPVLQPAAEPRAQGGGGAPEADSEELGTEDDEALDDIVYARPAAPVEATPEPVSAAQAFQLELSVTQLRREIELQRGELAGLRERISAFEETLRNQKEQMESSLVRQGVSPEYNEALLYAQRGLDVEAIAERCGITVAEAELVCSLARRQAGDGEGA